MFRCNIYCPEKKEPVPNRSQCSVRCPAAQKVRQIQGKGNLVVKILCRVSFKSQHESFSRDPWVLEQGQTFKGHSKSSFCHVFWALQSRISNVTMQMKLHIMNWDYEINRDTRSCSNTSHHDVAMEWIFLSPRRFMFKFNPQYNSTGKYGLPLANDIGWLKELGLVKRNVVPFSILLSFAPCGNTAFVPLKDIATQYHVGSTEQPSPDPASLLLLNFPVFSIMRNTFLFFIN